ncbi:Hypothetical protein CpMEX30_0024 [Corynebacterium pseudotuberculosis]|nr:Hypothetical protein CpPAT10_0022 [Corynebacterium pseudotuberculosis PAT10]AEP69300.1 Hypothetical protein Cp4202_0021 [Corynebacterium pseudotuberculosis 42/02-A]AER68149.1 Hypothetical protein Cp106_0020 [Corynebacterium pseudotuberculosis 1/06-A]AFF21189.1 Hypothetical protein CpP54B96_0023 [Corynebacterium pseudotuberculosis P54B96]AFH50932.1 Hypothetical protein Cp267_0023 [Corynebacterium pseudotuberculosis 267]AJC12761.1 Hypothetical protein CpVD57_0022 [Corynebacterium pseudotuberc
MGFMPVYMELSTEITQIFGIICSSHNDMNYPQELSTLWIITRVLFTSPISNL